MVQGSGGGSRAALQARNKKARNLGELEVDASCGYDKGHVKLLASLTAAAGRLSYSTDYMQLSFFNSGIQYFTYYEE